MAFVVSCEDPFNDKATYENAEQTFVVAALTGSDLTAPAGLQLATRAVVRIDGVFDFDLAFDVNSAGKAVVLPVGLVGTPVTGSRSIGLARTTGGYTAVTEAPKNGYYFDSTMAIAPGEAVVILSRQAACQYALTPNSYAKVTVDSISANRTLYGRALINLNCGKRQLTSGLPAF